MPRRYARDFTPRLRKFTQPAQALRLLYELSAERSDTMGQYYRFLNTTKETESEIGLPFNFNLPWAKNLNDCSREELEKIFEFVRKGNDWPKTDKVMAMGDYGDIIYDADAE
jgi:hypothetical protein